jgi:hypothetical protein
MCESLQTKKKEAPPAPVSNTWRVRGLVGYESLRRVRRSSSLCAIDGGLARWTPFLGRRSPTATCARGFIGVPRGTYMLMCSPN